jgi:hypothetical protein
VVQVKSKGDIVAGAGWCKFAGFVTWAFGILIFAHFVIPR